MHKKISEKGYQMDSTNQSNTQDARSNKHRGDFMITNGTGVIINDERHCWFPSIEDAVNFIKVQARLGKYIDTKLYIVQIVKTAQIHSPAIEIKSYSNSTSDSIPNPALCLNP